MVVTVRPTLVHGRLRVITYILLVIILFYSLFVYLAAVTSVCSQAHGVQLFVFTTCRDLFMRLARVCHADKQYDSRIINGKL